MDINMPEIDYGKGKIQFYSRSKVCALVLVITLSTFVFVLTTIAIIFGLFWIFGAPLPLMATAPLAWLATLISGPLSYWMILGIFFGLWVFTVVVHVAVSIWRDFLISGLSVVFSNMFEDEPEEIEK